MPTYEYRCNNCEKTFEVFKSIKDETVPSCPYCGSNDVIRLISPTSFILKGSGWYVTDYGRGSSTASSSVSSSKTTKSDSKNSKSESSGTKKD